MSTTIIAVIVNLLAILLPYFGIELHTERLTDLVQTLVAIGTGIWIWYQRVKIGDVTTLGVRKN